VRDNGQETGTGLMFVPEEARRLMCGGGDCDDHFLRLL
jgi:hypothetical protein